MGTGHSHHGSHRADRRRDAEFEVARVPRTVLLASLALAGLAALVGLVGLWPSGSEVDEATEGISFAAPGVTFPTAVVAAVQQPCESAANGAPTGQDCGSIEVVVEEGADEGERLTVSVSPPVHEVLTEGDEVVLQGSPTQDGQTNYSYWGTARTTPLLVMTLAFVALVIAVARWRGFFGLLGLLFSGLVIWKFMLPALLVGESGLLVGLVGSTVIMFVVLYTTHGFSIRTSAALAGTFGGMLVTAGLGVLATGVTRLTGLADESAGILSTLVGDLSFQGLFACAIVVAGLGVLNDVTITQASAVWEIRGAAPAMSRAQVFASSMRIGRDHIASTIYTIVFAYAGTALAVLMILQLYGLPVRDLLATEEIGEELVRTLASSMGLVLAVPLTTAIAALTVPGASSESRLRGAGGAS